MCLNFPVKAQVLPYRYLVDYKLLYVTLKNILSVCPSIIQASLCKLIPSHQIKSTQHINQLSKDRRILIREFNAEDCLTTESIHRINMSSALTFIYLFFILFDIYITVVCMLPHTFLALLLKIREGVVRGKSYYDYDTYFSTMSHVHTVTTSINL